MRILQVAPLVERVPPVAYGGTERVVAYLTDALVELGHDVTLLASGDSITKARLLAVSPRALRLDEHCVDPLAHQIRQVELVAGLADQFDLVHFHTGFLHMPVAKRLGVLTVTTLHGRLDVPDLVPLMDEFRDLPLVSISDAQRQPLEGLHWCGTVYHGLPFDLLPFNPDGGDYLAFVGRISPEKRVDRAIALARRTGLPLRIAAKVDPVDERYFEREIEPLLALPNVSFLGEIADEEKATLLGGARALLFPIDWPEPFGMVVIEALSCGTPVIAWNHGSVPELIADGVTGWIVDSEDAAVEAVTRLEAIDRRACRAAFERRFVAQRMARDYVRIYQELLREQRPVRSLELAG
jgi:glycosyltransferase involved in cell wall biosynthesis